MLDEKDRITSESATWSLLSFLTNDVFMPGV